MSLFGKKSARSGLPPLEPNEKKEVGPQWSKTFCSRENRVVLRFLRVEVSFFDPKTTESLGDISRGEDFVVLGSSRESQYGNSPKKTSFSPCCCFL